MKRICKLAYLTAFICLPLKADINFDKQEKINGVELQTGKIESTRHYKGNISNTFSFPIETLKEGITNFSEKCNNQFKSKRTLTDPEADCKFQAEELIESKVIKDIGYAWEKVPQETERYLVARQVYRRGKYAHYDLVQVSHGKNSMGQKTITVKLNMLNDKEVEQYIKPAFGKDSDFTRSSEVYVLTALSPNETKLNYHYEAETEHWLLNKQLSVPQVFASIGQNIREKMKILNDAGMAGKREVASHK